jgi:hypothetical protein
LLSHQNPICIFLPNVCYTLCPSHPPWRDHMHTYKTVNIVTCRGYAWRK